MIGASMTVQTATHRAAVRYRFRPDHAPAATRPDGAPTAEPTERAGATSALMRGSGG